MNYENLKPIQGHIALFFSPDFQLKALDMANKIQKNMEMLFGVEPSTVPFPPGAPIPLEVPRVVLQGDAAGQITVSQLRADMTVNFSSAVSLDVQLSDYIYSFASCFEEAKIVRIGFVLQFDILEENVMAAIRNRYICNEKLEDAKELFIGWVKKIDILDIHSNRLVNFSCNVLPLPSGVGRLVVDTNTVPEQIMDLTPDDIKNFVNECIKHYKGDLSGFIE